MPTATRTFQELKQIYEKAGQDHVLQYYNELPTQEQEDLLQQLSSIDPLRVNKIFGNAMAASKIPIAEKGALSALPADAVQSWYTATETEIVQWRELGLKLVSQNKVAVLLMAGGQGTRLGSSAPKGCYNIGLPSQKSLFQLQGERIAKIQALASEKTKSTAGAAAKIVWYVMTSGPTRKDTEAFFRDHKFFGLDEAQVVFFEQGVLPAMTPEGKIFLETKSRLSVAPDGNGGVYRALLEEGILSDMARRGVTHVHAYCVDNCLVRVADPVFIGHAVARNADCDAKVVRKLVPEEPVGLVVYRKNKPAVVEYSECDKTTMELRDPAQRGEKEGALAYRAANIANHLFTLSFLQKCAEMESAMEYHVAHKKIKHVDLQSGETVAPQKPNGVKMELFVFDVFALANKFAVLEGKRADEFSPLKNAPGSGVDCPETSRRDILDQHRRFLRNAGATIDDSVEIEIDAAVSYEGEGLEQTVKGKLFTVNTHAKTINDL